MFLSILFAGHHTVTLPRSTLLVANTLFVLFVIVVWAGIFFGAPSELPAAQENVHFSFEHSVAAMEELHSDKWKKAISCPCSRWSTYARAAVIDISKEHGGNFCKVKGNQIVGTQRKITDWCAEHGCPAKTHLFAQILGSLCIDASDLYDRHYRTVIDEAVMQFPSALPEAQFYTLTNATLKHFGQWIEENLGMSVTMALGSAQKYVIETEGSPSQLLESGFDISTLMKKPRSFVPQNFPEDIIPHDMRLTWEDFIFLIPDVVPHAWFTTRMCQPTQCTYQQVHPGWGYVCLLAIVLAAFFSKSLWVASVIVQALVQHFFLGTTKVLPTTAEVKEMSTLSVCSSNTTDQCATNQSKGSPNEEEATEVIESTPKESSEANFKPLYPQYVSFFDPFVPASHKPKDACIHCCTDIAGLIFAVGAALAVIVPLSFLTTTENVKLAPVSASDIDKMTNYRCPCKNQQLKLKDVANVDILPQSFCVDWSFENAYKREYSCWTAATSSGPCSLANLCSARWMDQACKNHLQEGKILTEAVKAQEFYSPLALSRSKAQAKVTDVSEFIMGSHDIRHTLLDFTHRSVSKLYYNSTKKFACRQFHSDAFLGYTLSPNYATENIFPESVRSGFDAAEKVHPSLSLGWALQSDSAYTSETVLDYDRYISSCDPDFCTFTDETPRYTYQELSLFALSIFAAVHALQFVLIVKTIVRRLLRLCASDDDDGCFHYIGKTTVCEIYALLTLPENFTEEEAETPSFILAFRTHLSFMLITGITTVALAVPLIFFSYALFLGGNDDFRELKPQNSSEFLAAMDGVSFSEGSKNSTLRCTFDTVKTSVITQNLEVLPHRGVDACRIDHLKVLANHPNCSIGSACRNTFYYVAGAVNDVCVARLTLAYRYPLVLGRKPFTDMTIFFWGNTAFSSAWEDDYRLVFYLVQSNYLILEEFLMRQVTRMSIVLSSLHGILESSPSEKIIDVYATMDDPYQGVIPSYLSSTPSFVKLFVDSFELKVMTSFYAGGNASEYIENQAPLRVTLKWSSFLDHSLETTNCTFSVHGDEASVLQYVTVITVLFSGCAALVALINPLLKAVIALVLQS